MINRIGHTGKIYKALKPHFCNCTYIVTQPIVPWGLSAFDPAELALCSLLGWRLIKKEEEEKEKRKRKERRRKKREKKRDCVRSNELTPPSLRATRVRRAIFGQLCLIFTGSNEERKSNTKVQFITNSQKCSISEFLCNQANFRRVT